MMKGEIKPIQKDSKNNSKAITFLTNNNKNNSTWKEIETFSKLSTAAEITSKGWIPVWSYLLNNLDTS